MTKEERQHEKDKLVQFKHTAGSKQPRYDLIPYNSLKALADRFELGENKYKDKSWNANKNHLALLDDDWIYARAAHVVQHALLYMAKMRGEIPDNGDDDAGAIMWGGTVLSEAKRMRNVHFKT